MTRQEANREILKILSEYIELYPHMRFSQILYNEGFVQRLDISTWKDEFYLESSDLLVRLGE